MEEGSETEPSQQEFGLVVGELDGTVVVAIVEVAIVVVIEVVAVVAVVVVLVVVLLYQ